MSNTCPNMKVQAVGKFNTKLVVTHIYNLNQMKYKKKKFIFTDIITYNN